jgi:hypothetical protein
LDLGRGEPDDLGADPLIEHVRVGRPLQLAVDLGWPHDLGELRDVADPPQDERYHLVTVSNLHDLRPQPLEFVLRDRGQQSAPSM